MREDEWQQFRADLEGPAVHSVAPGILCRRTHDPVRHRMLAGARSALRCLLVIAAARRCVSFCRWE
jgi:hypothetical protein